MRHRRLVLRASPFVLVALVLLPLAILSRPSLAVIELETKDFDFWANSPVSLATLNANRVHLQFDGSVDVLTGKLTGDDGADHDAPVFWLQRHWDSSFEVWARDDRSCRNQTETAKKSNLAVSFDAAEAGFKLRSSNDGSVRVDILGAETTGAFFGGELSVGQAELSLSCKNCELKGVAPLDEVRGRLSHRFDVQAEFAGAGKNFALIAWPVFCGADLVSDWIVLTEPPRFSRLVDGLQQETTVEGRAKITFLEFEKTVELEPESFLRPIGVDPEDFDPFRQILGIPEGEMKLEKVRLSNTGMSVRFSGRFRSISVGADSARKTELVPSYLEYFYLIRELSWLLYISLVLGLGGLVFAIFKELGFYQGEE